MQSLGKIKALEWMTPISSRARTRCWLGASHIRTTLHTHIGCWHEWCQHTHKNELHSLLHPKRYSKSTQFYFYFLCWSVTQQHKYGAPYIARALSEISIFIQYASYCLNKKNNWQFKRSNVFCLNKCTKLIMCLQQIMIMIFKAHFTVALVYANTAQQKMSHWPRSAHMHPHDRCSLCACTTRPAMFIQMVSSAHYFENIEL